MAQGRISAPARRAIRRKIFTDYLTAPEGYPLTHSKLVDEAKQLGLDVRTLQQQAREAPKRRRP